MSNTTATVKKPWLPAPGSWKYHLLLGAVAILFLGPLGGITSSFMVFKIGFFVGGQVLAGILGSAVTFGYGAEGRHGANYMQTLAASVASMAAMGTLIQAMVWLGFPERPAWQLILYLGCIGFFGVGVGMLYTPILVDRLRLTFPSGLAVANILRALTDKKLLQRSIAKLGAGMAAGFVGGLAAVKILVLETIGLSTSTLGAGMIVGARIGIPAFTAGLLFHFMTPYFISIGWLKEGEPFRKITFLIALGMIMGAAIVDLTIIGYKAFAQVKEVKEAGPAGAPADESWKKTNTGRLVAWVVVWGLATIASGHMFLDIPVFFLAMGIALVFVFVMINGISLGVSDSNPISSAFVVSVLLMAVMGLGDPGIGLFAAGIILVSASIAGDMQQDRSTGWRLGTSRVVQFRYQVIGVTMGAVLAVVFAKLFMAAYPILQVNPLSGVDAQNAVEESGWQSAMTFKFAGALAQITKSTSYTYTAIGLGVLIGFAIEFLRKIIKRSESYRAFAKSSKTGFAVDFTLDAIFLPSPYAFSFGGFVSLETSTWFGGGGLLSSLYNTVSKRIEARKRASAGSDALPEDMSTTSLVGGGLIAGDSLAALVLGIIGLLASMLG